MTNDQLRHWRDHHNGRTTRSALRLVSELQAPLADRLRLLLAHASGPFTQITLADAIAGLSCSTGASQPQGAGGDGRGAATLAPGV